MSMVPHEACLHTPPPWRDGVLPLPEAFLLDSGEVLCGGRLAWQCVGPAQAPLVVVLGGISAHARCCAADGSGWWESQCGAGRSLDINRYRLLGVDWLGGSGAASGAGEAREYPVISSADQARAALLLLNRLGVRHVHLLVGASYGGAVAQHLALLLGDRLARLLLLCAAHRSSQYALAMRELQRALLDLGGNGETGLALARALAILGYRTAEGLEQRFAAGGGVLDWLVHHGTRFAQHFSAASYRCLGASLDTHALNPAQIRAPTTLFGVREDQLVPPSLLREYAARAAHCEYIEISSQYGHDAFLKEHAQVGALLRKTLEQVA